MIYDFLRKVQDAHKDAVKATQEFEGQGQRERAQLHRTRANTLYTVLQWAGFDDCDIAVKRGGES